MPLAQAVQSAIHRLETGRGLRFMTYILVALAVIARVGFYDLRSFQNMSAPEAMDAAQLARNLARGRGFTTEFVRPLSIYLVQQKATGTNDPAHLDSGHPDISNPPAYPVVLAGLMNILPFHYDNAVLGAYQPDFLIAVFNQVLFIAVILLAFFWARWLFDAWVAWTSFFLLLITPTFWQFAASGLSTILLMLIFMGLFWCLTLFEREAREPKWGAASLLALSVAMGVLMGWGALTRYSFMWMIIPVGIFLALFGGPRRAVFCVTTIVVFALVFGPWLFRNYIISGTPFGTASYSLVEGFSPAFQLQRSLQPEFPHFHLSAFIQKAGLNLLPVLQSDLFENAGGWIAAFFLVGLVLGFRNLTLRRLRYFLVAGLVTLAIAQALGRTQLSDETPEFNAENLLVLLAPVMLVYGVAIFYSLLDNLKLPSVQARYTAIGIFLFVLSLPALLGILAGRKDPVVYPPYRPDIIQNSSTRILKPTELMMSDIPWAVAWYGDRQCVWLTRYAEPAPGDAHQLQESFYAMNALKPVSALYLTPESLDSRFQSQWMRAGEGSWGDFIVNAMIKHELPDRFPLTKMPAGYWPEQLLLSDTVRW